MESSIPVSARIALVRAARRSAMVAADALMATPEQQRTPVPSGLPPDLAAKPRL